MTLVEFYSLQRSASSKSGSKPCWRDKAITVYTVHICMLTSAHCHFKEGVGDDKLAARICRCILQEHGSLVLIVSWCMEAMHIRGNTLWLQRTADSPRINSATSQSKGAGTPWLTSQCCTQPALLSPSRSIYSVMLPLLELSRQCHCLALEVQRANCIPSNWLTWGGGTLLTSSVTSMNRNNCYGVTGSWLKSYLTAHEAGHVMLYCILLQASAGWRSKWAIVSTEHARLPFKSCIVRLAL